MARTTTTKPAVKPSASSAPRILESRILPEGAATFAAEALEPRIVFAVNVGAGLASATVLSNPQIAEIIDGLEDIGALGDALEQLGALAEPLANIGASFSDLFNLGTSNGLGGFLGDAFRDQLNGALGVGTTVAQVNALLNTSPLAGTTGAYSGVTWSLGQGGEYTGANPFEWEVTISGTKTTTQSFEPDLSADEIVLSGAEVSVDAEASLTFSFGLTATNDFFATFGDMTFTVSAAQPLLGMTGDLTYTVNGNDYAYTLVTGSTVALGAEFGDLTISGDGYAAAQIAATTWVSGDANHLAWTDGAWSRDEITDLTGDITEDDFSIATTTDDGMQATIRFGSAGNPTVQLTLADDAILDTIAPETGHDIALVDYAVGGNITGIFQRVQDAAALLDNNPLRKVNIPGIGTALDGIESLPAFADLLTLRDTANTYMQLASTTLGGLADALSAKINTTLSEQGITLDTLEFVRTFDPVTNSMLLTFNVDTGDITEIFGFDRFGAAAAQAGLAFDRNETFQIEATLRAMGDFTLGLDLTVPAGNAASVFFTTGGINASVEFDVTGVSLEGTLGPVAVSIENGEIHASAALAIELTHAGADGRYTLAEFDAGADADFDFTPSGDFESILPVDIQIAGATFVNPTIRLFSDDIFTSGVTVDSGNANFDKIFNMGKVSPAAILDMVIAVGDWASNFRNAELFNLNVPFLDADLGDVFDFGLLFAKNLKEKMQETSFVALSGEFAPFTLAANADLMLQDGSPVPPHFILPAGTYATKQGFIDSLNTALGASSPFEAEAHGDNGVRIKAKDVEATPDFTLIGPAKTLKAIGFLDANYVVTSALTLPNAPVATGKIANTAVFQISVDGSAPTDVTITKVSTDDNTGVVSLAADLDAALATFGVDVTVSGGKMHFSQIEGKSFMVAGKSGPYASFGFNGVNPVGAGLSEVDSEQLNFESLTDLVPFLLDELGIGDGDGDPSNDPIRARYDLATETFYLHFEHEFEAPTFEIPVGFGFELDGWADIHTIGANPKLTIAPTIGGSFDFGISLADDSSFEEIAISAPFGFAPNGYNEKLDGKGVPTGAPNPDSAIAWDGKLTADAVFKVSFDNNVEHTLTVAKSATTTNTDAEDILADVLAAIAANANLNGKLSARVIDAEGGSAERIEFFTLEQAGSDFQIRSLRIRAVGADADVRMGFQPDSFAVSTAAALAVGSNAAAAPDYSPATDMTFSLALNGGAAATLTVPTASMSTNANVEALVADLNTAIAGNATFAGKVTAIRHGYTSFVEFIPAGTTTSVNANGANAAGISALVDYSPAGDAAFEFSLDGSAPATLTVTQAAMAGCKNMTHLLTAINAAITANPELNGNIIAIRQGLGTQFQFVTADGTRQLSFKATSAVAQDTFGFGEDTITSRSRGGTFFIKDASLHASVAITLEDVDIAANIGFIGVQTEGLSGSVTLNADITLIDGTNTRFEIGELFSRVANGSIGDVVDFEFTGEAHAELSGLTVSAAGLSVSATASVELDSPNIFAVGGPEFVVTFNGVDPTKLMNFSNASWKQIYEGIKLGVQVLSQTEQFGFLGDTKIPLINLSVTEIFTFTDQLVAIVDQLEQNPGGALDDVEHEIEQRLGIPDSAFDLSLDEANSTINIHLGISTSYSTSYGLDFDLAELAKYTDAVIPADLLTLSGFLDASAEGNLQFGAFAGLSLDLGIDFSGTEPNLIVYATSGLDVGFRVVGQNLNISATLGPAGVQISNATVVFDGDGIYDADGDDLQDDDFANIHFGPLADITDIQGVIDDIDGGASLGDYFGPTFTGKLEANLPAAITSDIGTFDLPGPIVVRVEDFYKLFDANPLVRKDAIELTLPDFAELLPEIPGLIQLLRDPAILLDGVDSGLGLVQKLINGKAATKLPLIGDQLRSGAGFIAEFRAGFLADLTKKLRGAGDTLLETLQVGMFDLFGDSGDGANGLALGLLLDYNGDGITNKDDVVLTFRNEDGSIWHEGDDPHDQEAVMFNLHLGQSITFGTDLELDWGMPGLDLDINGSPELTASWDFYFGFGVSINDYFFLDAAPPVEFTGSGATLDVGVPADHELELKLEAVLTPDGATPFSATGRLFFLQLDATDMKNDDDEYSHVSGSLFVDLTDPGTGNNQDGRVTVKELFSRGAIKPITAGLEVEAVINLGLVGSVQGSAVIPRILADFHIDARWTLGGPTPTPNVGFENVRLDLGSFVTDFLKPIVDKVDEIIKPFDPVLDALQTRIPVLSDFLGRDYTVLDLAVQFGKVDRRFVDAVIQIRDLISDIAALPTGVNIVIPIGELAGLGTAFSTKDGAKNVNTSSTGTTAVGFGAVAPGSDEERYRNTFDKSTKITGGGFGFPILKPANAFKLLLGQEATLITYDIPRLEVGMSMSRTFPIWGPLVGKFSGSVTAFADFAVGFDTKGFNTYKTSGDVLDILDGFFISDRANADGTGADVPEAGFKGRIAIGGAINAAVIEAGIEGFFELTATLDMKDPNDDGKIRGSEMLALINHPNGYSFLNLGSITLKGEVGARAYVDFWAPFDWYNAWEWEFARITLFEKTFTAPDVTPTIAPAPVMVGTENTVTLYAGATANKRNFISTSDVGEAYEVTGSGRDITIKFLNTEHTVTYTGIDRIVMSGGKGNDSITIGAGVTTAVTFDGGEGDDTFIGGSGNDIIIGGTGNDEIRGGAGNNTLDGGEGADLIVGGSGADTIIGGDGDDTFDGGGGTDTYKFGNGWGNDVINDGQTGSGTFDFTDTTNDLTINISRSGAQGSSGDNFIEFDQGGTTAYITKVLGGAGNDTAVIAATGDAQVTVNGGQGSDSYLVSFGRLESAIQIEDDGTGAVDYDSVSITPLSTGFNISVFDQSVSGTKSGLAFTQTANFGNNIENLLVDAKSKGGRISIAEPISFTGDVKLLALEATILNTINAGNLRIESTLAVNVGANVNARDNGDVTILVNGGNITVTEDILSSAGDAFSGDGAGLVHLYSAGGSIVTGSGNGGPGRILAADGALLLRGTNGNIGSLAMPIYSTVSLLSASTTGNGLVNLHESDGVTVGVIGSFEGIKTEGGTLNVFNDDNKLIIAAPVLFNGADGVFTSDEIQIDARIASPGGDVLIQPEGITTVMGIGESVVGEFDIDQAEFSNIEDGFATVTIGRTNGRNLINLGELNFSDPLFLQNPALGGHITQTGDVTGTGNATLTILGSGHTTQLSNQNVADGNIDIVDSVFVAQGQTVTLVATDLPGGGLNGNINVNFDVDGFAGGADETLILTADREIIIKGNIGAGAQLGTLRITSGTTVRFEGTVNVKTLDIQDGASFTVDGTILAESVQISGVPTVNFKSGTTLTTGLTLSGATLTTAVFEGQISASSVTVTAQNLVDFYQLVDVTTSLNVTTTAVGGDIVFRQQVNAHGGDIVVGSLDDITFIGPVTSDDLTVSGVDSLAMQANTQLSGALTQTAGSGVTTLAQLTAASANVTSAGLILGGITTITGASGLLVRVGAGAFNAIGSVSAAAGALDIAARTISFQNTAAAASATLVATETISLANASSFTLTGSLSATTTSATVGEIKFTGPANIGGDATLTTPRALSFQDRLDVANDLTVTRASSAQYQGAVDVNGAFAQEAGVTGPTSFSQTLSVGSMDVNAASFTFTGDVTSSGNVVVNATAGAIGTAANVSVAGTLQATASGSINLQGSTGAFDITATAGTSLTVGVGGMTTALSSTAGNIALRANGTAPGNSMTLNGAIAAKGLLDLNSARGILATETLNSNSLAVVGVPLTFNSLVSTTANATFTSTGLLNLAAGLSAGGVLNVTTASAVTLGDAVTVGSATINAVNTINVPVAGFTSTIGSIVLNTTAPGAGIAVSALGPIDAATALNITTPRGVALNLVNAVTFTVNAASINLPSAVTTTGATTLTAAATGNITAGSTIAADGAFTITRAKAVSFSGLVSADSISIGQGGGDSIETVSVGSGGMTALNDLRIRTTVAGAGAGITTLGTLSAGNAATVALDSVRGVDASGSISTGNLSVNGASITLRSTVNAADDVTLTSAGTVSVQSDITAGDALTVDGPAAVNFGAKVTATGLSVANTGSATFDGQVNLSDYASLTLTSDLTTTAGFHATNSLTVVSVRHASFGGLVTSATASIGDTSARSVTVGAAGIATSDALTIRATAVGGALNINGPLTASGAAVSLFSAGTITATATISGNTVGVVSPGISLGGAVNSDSGDVTLDSIVSGVGSVIVGGIVTTSGSLRVGTITAPQSAALNGALNIGQDLTLIASETLSTGARITVGRDASLATTSATLGETRINGILSVGRNLTLNTLRDATFLAPVSAGGNALVSRAAGLQMDGAFTVTGSLTQTLGTTSSRFATITAASIALNSETIAVTNAVTATIGGATFTAAATGKVSVGGNTNIAGALNITRADEAILTGNVSAASVTVGADAVRTMSFGTNLAATAGDISLIGGNGPVSVMGTLDATGSLSIPSGTVITLNSAVRVANATIAGSTLVTGSDFTTTVGGLTVTTTGDVTVGGKTTIAQALSIIGSEDVTLNGAVSASEVLLIADSFLAGGALTATAADANFATSGNIRVVGLASIAHDLIINTALNTTFQGQVAVTGNLVQTDGGGATRFEGVTAATNINVRTAQQIFAGSVLRANGGDTRLEADEIDFFGGTNAVQGTANLILRPYLATTTIDIGSPTPTGLLDLSDVDVNALQDGFSQITIGRTEDGVGAMLIGSSSFRDNVAFHAGSIVVENNPLVGQVVITPESIEMTANPVANRSSPHELAAAE